MAEASNDEITPRTASVARWTTLAAGTLAGLIAVIVLLGCATGSRAMTKLFLPSPGMKANIALGLLLVSVALLVLPARAGARRLVGLLAVGLAQALAIATLIEYRFDVDLGIDELLFRDYRGSDQVPGAPGRMSPLAIANLTFFSLGWFATRSPSLRSRWVAGFPAKMMVISSLFTLCGYLFGPPTRYGLGNTTNIAPHTSLAFLLLALGLLARRPRHGIFSMLVAEDAGGTLVRRLLPAAIAVPLGFAGTRLGSELWDVKALDFGLAILVSVYVLVLVWLVGRSGASVGRYDRGRSRAEAALRAANEELEARVASRTRELERAMRARADFLARMSHEIRTPMNAVLGMIDLALQTELGPEQREYLTATETSARLLLAIINDILDFSKIDAGKLRLEAIPFRLVETVTEPLRPLAILARRKGVELRFEARPATPAGVIGDPLRLGQVLINLVSNAIKFTERGEVVVTLDARPLGPEIWEIQLEVQDTGAGIPADKQEAIFEAFSQADEATTRTHGGTGLGLAICSQLVDLMGGKIQVDSEPGQGSRFSVSLPLKLHQAPRDANASAPHRPGAPLTPSLRILVGEDNPFNRMVIGPMLEKAGHTVEMADDGAQVLAALSARSFDLVLMDLQMPVVDGLEATRQLRASGNRTPIVAVTAQALRGVQERCLAAGMDGYLTKPIERSELMRVLARFSSAGARPPAPAPPPAPAAFQTGLVFDREQLLERTSGDQQLLGELVDLYRQTAPAMLEAVKTASAAGDAAALEQAAHALVGLLLNLAAAPAAERARSLETLARGRDLTGAAAGIGGLEAALRSLDGSLQAELRS